MGVTQILTAPYSKQNAIVERANKEMLRHQEQSCMIDESKVIGQQSYQWYNV